MSCNHCESYPKASAPIDLGSGSTAYLMCTVDSRTLEKRPFLIVGYDRGRAAQFVPVARCPFCGRKFEEETDDTD